jgi:seryl-tRNA synthetase
MLAQEYNEIKTELDTKTKRPPTNIDPDLHREGEKVTELENALNSLNSEYKELEESYNKLSEAYSNAIVQIQQNNHDEVGTPQDEAMIRLESDLREA